MRWVLTVVFGRRCKLPSEYKGFAGSRRIELRSVSGVRISLTGSVEMSDSNEFEKGFKLRTYNGKQIEIIKYLGGGGQGSVYEIDYGGEKKALKWYKQLGTDPKKFYKNLQNNVEKGSPDENVFLWP